MGIVTDSVLQPLVDGFWKGIVPGPVDWAKNRKQRP